MGSVRIWLIAMEQDHLTLKLCPARCDLPKGIIGIVSGQLPEHNPFTVVAVRNGATNRIAIELTLDTLRSAVNSCLKTQSAGRYVESQVVQSRNWRVGREQWAEPFAEETLRVS